MRARAAAVNQDLLLMATRIFHRQAVDVGQDLVGEDRTEFRLEHAVQGIARCQRIERLVEQLTPLRLGILAPDMAVAQLKAKGVKLRRLPPAPSADRRPRPATRKAIASIRPALALVGPQSPGKTKAAR